MIILTRGCIYVRHLTMKAPQRNSRSHSRSHSGRRTAGLSHSEGMTTGTVASHRNPQATRSTYFQGSTPFAGRKSQMANGNHLLNFQYDPISRSQQRGHPPPPFARRLTLDVYLSVRHAISDLDGWLARADSGLVVDLEKLPYVSAAMQ
ncbi:hypothetical protein KIW84_022744 [Lathyrus oleraceus]|uniref:Uncharacterized protein n=1 Tax=Pisum sativum TaxID=3888 RepID=A0A9D4YFM8_PEA|nr:hypothetical protein KIW84_022744 [Pisum sativum]